jgi:hypothetical protein
MIDERLGHSFTTAEVSHEFHGQLYYHLNPDRRAKKSDDDWRIIASNN